MGQKIVINNSSYTVVRVGKPVFCKAPTINLLRSIKFTVADLTLVDTVANGTRSLHHVVWCLLAHEQKIVSETMFKEIKGMSPNEDVTLDVAYKTKKRKAKSDVLGPLTKQKFVLVDAALGDKTALTNFNFNPLTQDTLLAQLRTLAEMFLCMTKQPSLEQLHRWAGTVLQL